MAETSSKAPKSQKVPRPEATELRSQGADRAPPVREESCKTPTLHKADQQLHKLGGT